MRVQRRSRQSNGCTVRRRHLSHRQRLTGGGVENFGFSPLAETASEDNTSWIAATLADPAVDTVDVFVVSAVCFSPKRRVSGLSFYTTRKTQIRASLVTAVARAAAKC